jgi:rubrerythrin
MRAKAEEAAGHAFGHLDHLFDDDAAETLTSIGTTPHDLVSAAEQMSEETAAMYAGMARTAHEDGFDDIADWFETLAKAEHSEVCRWRPSLHT